MAMRGRLRTWNLPYDETTQDSLGDHETWDDPFRIAWIGQDVDDDFYVGIHAEVE